MVYDESDIELASSRGVDIASYFDGLQHNMRDQRGRILTEPVAPFFITSCDGAAAKILGLQGASRLTGRRLQSIAYLQDDVSKLGAAPRAVISSFRRAFLNISAKDGRRVPVMVQVDEDATGRLQLEILLFPAHRCHLMLFKDFIPDAQ